MIRVIFTDTSCLPDPKEAPQLLSKVPSARRGDVLRPVCPETRKLLLGAGILLGKGLELCGADAEKIVVGKDGKPRTEGICFSLSHSAQRAVLAVSAREVGCDVEQIRKIPPAVWRRLSKAEQEEIFSCQMGERPECKFFLNWTKRESYLKYTGEGTPKLLQIEIRGGEIFRGGKRADCFVKSLLLAGGYALSVCFEDAESLILEEIGTEG